MSVTLIAPEARRLLAPRFSVGPLPLGGDTGTPLAHLRLSMMRKHSFQLVVIDKGRLVGEQRVRCGQIALFEKGKIPAEFKSQKCPQRAHPETRCSARHRLT
jgi:hypothetical protein